jgi:nitric oxide reductase activation protein
LRHNWCDVFEEGAGPAGAAVSAVSAPVAAGAQPADTDGGIARRLERALLHRDRRLPPQPLQPEGEAVDTAALVRLRIAQRQRLPPDACIWRRAAPRRREGRLMVIIDQSASSADAWGRSGFDRLQASRRVSALLGAALKRPAELAIVGFSSNGRHEVVVRRVKGFAEAFGPPVRDRLAALRSAHSTRLGAAIRHASGQLGAHRPGGARQLLVISDGEPYDIDVHDRRYLIEDARQAVRSAARQGIRVHCIVLDRPGLVAARQVFGARHVGLLEAMAGLPELVARLKL